MKIICNFPTIVVYYAMTHTQTIKLLGIAIKLRIFGTTNTVKEAKNGI